MEEKERLDDFMNRLIEEIKSVEPRVFGGFTAKYEDNMDLTFCSNTGWSLRYPFGSETWTILSNLVNKWDDGAKTTIENFIKIVVFPACARLTDIDEEYVTDIVRAHTRLTERVSLKKNEQGSDRD